MKIFKYLPLLKSEAEGRGQSLIFKWAFLGEESSLRAQLKLSADS